jgi:NAD(P)-dependent dehydrogenase (short-subunit alcohol dehydrogenase family)
MLTLQGRKACVLGGTTGIGLATAKRLADGGAKVTVGGRDREHLAEASTTLADGVQMIAVDATDPDSLRHFYAEAGPIDDLVVTVTRRGGAGPAEDMAGQDLVDAFAGKPAAHLRAVALALPTLDATGSITLVGAGSATSGTPRYGGACRCQWRRRGPRSGRSPAS